MLDQAVADRDRAIAGVNSAKAALTAAEANLDGDRGPEGRGGADAPRSSIRAVDKAQSDLDAHARSARRRDGVVGNRAAQPGQYVVAGLAPDGAGAAGAASISPRTSRRRSSADPGPARAVDVVGRFDGRPELRGARSAALSPASGSTFSLLPPENATGNFTKITQRLPVRIEVPAELAAKGVLRPGLSVVGRCRVDKRT